MIGANSILEWMLPLRIKDFTRGILGYAKIIGFRPATSWDSAVRSTTGYSSDESVQDFLERKSSFHRGVEIPILDITASVKLLTHIGKSQ